MNKRYLGDGVYIEVEERPGFHPVFKLTTYDGIMNTNSIYLEPDVAQHLVNYITGSKTEER